MGFNNIVFLFIISIVAIASGCVSNTASSPEKAAEIYTSSLTQDQADTESAFKLLSSEVKAQKNYTEYQENITQYQSKYQDQDFTTEFVKAETLEKNGTNARVNVTLKHDLSVPGTTTIGEKIDLTKEDGSWRINEPYNPHY